MMRKLIRKVAQRVEVGEQAQARALEEYLLSIGIPVGDVYALGTKFGLGLDKLGGGWVSELEVGQSGLGTITVAYPDETGNPLTILNRVTKVRQDIAAALEVGNEALAWLKKHRLSLYT
jgi:hypothetical protein